MSNPQKRRPAKSRTVELTKRGGSEFAESGVLDTSGFECGAPRGVGGVAAGAVVADGGAAPSCSRRHGTSLAWWRKGAGSRTCAVDLSLPGRRPVTHACTRLSLLFYLKNRHERKELLAIQHQFSVSCFLVGLITASLHEKRFIFWVDK